MDRFETAKNKFKLPEEQEIKDKEDVTILGFNSLNEPIELSSEDKKIRSYYCPSGTAKRVGIIYNDLNAVFIINKVHYYNRTYFICAA